MSWHRGALVAFDTETTSPLPTSARLVTATVCIIRPGEAVEFREWLVDPGCDIPAEATEVHGVTTERARGDGMPEAQAVTEIEAELYRATTDGAPLVAFNAAFDLTVMDRAKRRAGHERALPDFLVVDPHVIDKSVDRYRKGKRTLTATCEHYGVRLDGAHDSREDALAAARVAWAICERHPEVAGMSLVELHAEQAQWRSEQAASLQEYLRRKEPDAEVRGEWPVIPVDLLEAAS